MRNVLVAGIALALVSFAEPVSAYVVEVTTSVSVAGVEDTAQLDRAIRFAVGDVVAAAVAFTPTVVVLTNGRVVGDRLYLRLLIMDEEGERALGELTAAPDDESKAEPGAVLAPEQPPGSGSGGLARPAI